MEPPAQSISTEFKEATIAAIRQRGPEAVGLVLIGLARLTLATAALVILHFAGETTFGFDLMSIPFAGLSVISIALGFLATQGRQWGGPSEAPTQDDLRPLLPEPLRPMGAYGRLKKMFNRTDTGYFQGRFEREDGQEDPARRPGAPPRDDRPPHPRLR